MTINCTSELGIGILGPNAHARQSKYNSSTSVNHPVVAGRTQSWHFRLMVFTQNYLLNEHTLFESQANGQNIVIPWAVVTAESERPTAREEIYSLGRRSVPLCLS